MVQSYGKWPIGLLANKKNLAIGAYPLVSPTKAREKREEAKAQLLGGVDPSTAKQALKATQHEAAANSFQVIALEWHKTHMESKNEGHAKKVMARLVNDIHPWIGKRPITEIRAIALY